MYIPPEKNKGIRGHVKISLVNQIMTDVFFQSATHPSSVNRTELIDKIDLQCIIITIIEKYYLQG